MRTKDLLTWGLILYGIYKLAPAVEAAIGGNGAGSGGLGQGSCAPGQYESTEVMPAWARLQGRTFTAEGEQ